ncbi:unnamed protein product, partial [Didymodactylos carnosus]
NTTGLKRRQPVYHLQSASSSDEDDYEDDIDDSSTTNNKMGNDNFIVRTTQRVQKNKVNSKKTRGRVKINMEFIKNKIRRYTTFSKRKTGIMKKAYELATLTGTQVMLLVASETGHVYTFATRKLQPMITSEAGKALIQTCLNNSSEEEDAGSDNLNTRDEVDYEEVELFYKTPSSSTSTALSHNDVIIIDQPIKNRSNKETNVTNDVLNNIHTAEKTSIVNICERAQPSETPSISLQAIPSPKVRRFRKRFKNDTTDSTPSIQKTNKNEAITIPVIAQDLSLRSDTEIQQHHPATLTLPYLIVQPQQTTVSSPYTIDVNFLKNNDINFVFASSSLQSNMISSSNSSTSIETQTHDS